MNHSTSHRLYSKHYLQDGSIRISYAAKSLRKGKPLLGIGVLTLCIIALMAGKYHPGVVSATGWLWLLTLPVAAMVAGYFWRKAHITIRPGQSIIFGSRQLAYHEIEAFELQPCRGSTTNVFKVTAKTGSHTISVTLPISRDIAHALKHEIASYSHGRFGDSVLRAPQTRIQSTLVHSALKPVAADAEKSLPS